MRKEKTQNSSVRDRVIEREERERDTPHRREKDKEEGEGVQDKEEEGWWGGVEWGFRLKAAQSAELAAQCGACYQHTLPPLTESTVVAGSFIILCIIIYLSSYCPY